MSKNCFLLQKDIASPFTDIEIADLYKNFVLNLNIIDMGTVAAGTSSDAGSGGSYFYHWVRDSAASLLIYQGLVTFSDYEHILKKYTEWVLTMQKLPNENGIDIRGEPKYELPDGTLFKGDWARPQTDGASLISINLLKFANSLIENGQSKYVDDYLWNIKTGAINIQLDYVYKNYNNHTYDLWEETGNNDFLWNKTLARIALVMAATFAKNKNEHKLVKKYIKAANELEKQILKHWNCKSLIESDNRPYDGAVILAVNFESVLTITGAMLGPIFIPSSYKIAATVNTLNKLFTKLFPINTEDTDNKIPGILYGRYDGDTYCGGNPWVNITNNIAFTYYRAANDIYKNGLPDDKTTKMWLKSINYKNSVENQSEMVKLLLKAGDSILNRVHYHTKENQGDLYEQIDKNTGFMISSKNLTVNYSSLLNILKYRSTRPFL